MCTFFKSIAAVCLTVALGACGNVSHRVAEDGRSAGDVLWPTPGDTTPMHKGGTYPNLANLRQVRDGLNKAQVADLIGYPHFSEGVWGVREWNYLFNFRHPGSSEVTVCQYKVLFDDDRIARSFFWKPESCADVLDEAKPAPPPAAVGHPTKEVVTLSADALFPFAKGDVEDIMPAGRAEVAALAARLRRSETEVLAIHVIGYTDSIGTTTYNQDLSEHRAQAVRALLIEAGVPAANVTAEGLGESDPVKDCGDAPRAEQIACLAPNRRVEVRVDVKE